MKSFSLLNKNRNVCKLYNAVSKRLRYGFMRQIISHCWPYVLQMRRNELKYVRLLPSNPCLGADHLTLDGRGGGGGWGGFSACRKKKIACSTNVIKSLWEKKGKKYPAHQIARKKKFLMIRNHPPLPSRVKWSAPSFPRICLLILHK